MSDALYRCPVCGKEISADKKDSIPFCCGREMEPMPFCMKAPNPEMARNYDDDEPCDDATGPKQR